MLDDPHILGFSLSSRRKIRYKRLGLQQLWILSQRDNKAWDYLVALVHAKAYKVARHYASSCGASTDEAEDAAQYVCCRFLGEGRQLIRTYHEPRTLIFRYCVQRVLSYFSSSIDRNCSMIEDLELDVIIEGEVSENPGETMYVDFLVGKITNSEEDMCILDLMREGLSTRAIAKVTKQTRYKVEKKVKLFRKRAERWL